MKDTTHKLNQFLPLNILFLLILMGASSCSFYEEEELPIEAQEEETTVLLNIKQGLTYTIDDQLIINYQIEHQQDSIYISRTTHLAQIDSLISEERFAIFFPDAYKTLYDELAESITSLCEKELPQDTNCDSLIANYAWEPVMLFGFDSLRVVSIIVDSQVPFNLLHYSPNDTTYTEISTKPIRIEEYTNNPILSIAKPNQEPLYENTVNVEDAIVYEDIPLNQLQEETLFILERLTSADTIRFTHQVIDKISQNKNKGMTTVLSNIQLDTTKMNFKNWEYNASRKELTIDIVKD